MTKSEYREYIASEAWRRRRKMYMDMFDDPCCARCGATRDRVIEAYDVDLHVHHKSYARIGEEDPEDLELLCKRCHDIEHVGSSELPPIEPLVVCQCCGRRVFHVTRCAACETANEGFHSLWNTPHPLREARTENWKEALLSMRYTVGIEAMKEAVGLMAQMRKGLPISEWVVVYRQFLSIKGSKEE